MRTALLLAALLLSACNSTRPQPDERRNAELLAPPISPTSMSETPLPDINVGQSKPGILSGIGNLFSTPEGRANRQAVKLAKASVPRSIGKGGVWAPNAQTVANGFKSDGPTSAAAPNAVVSNAAENSQQQTVKGDNNGLTADKHDTTQEAKDWKAELATPVGKVVAFALAVLVIACVGGVLYYLIPLLPKRRKEPIL